MERFAPVRFALVKLNDEDEELERFAPVRLAPVKFPRAKCE